MSDDSVHMTSSATMAARRLMMESRGWWFFEGLKNQISTFCICADSFYFFCCQNKRWSFGLLLWKHLLIVKILPVTLFKLLVAAYRNPLLTVPYAGDDFVTCYGITFHKRQMIAGNFKGWIEAPNSLWVAASLVGGWGWGDSDAASGKMSKISQKFSSRNFKSTFRAVEEVKKN